MPLNGQACSPAAPSSTFRNLISTCQWRASLFSNFFTFPGAETDEPAGAWLGAVWPLNTLSNISRNPPRCPNLTHWEGLCAWHDSFITWRSRNLTTKFHGLVCAPEIATSRSALCATRESGECRSKTALAATSSLDNQRARSDQQATPSDQARAAPATSAAFLRKTVPQKLPSRPQWWCASQAPSTASHAPRPA